MDANEVLKRFAQIFRGDESQFVIHQPPFHQKPDSMKLTAEWAGHAKYGKKSFPKVPDGYELGDSVPVTMDQYKAHLNGDYGVALSPLIPQDSKGKQKNFCWYGIIDIDVYDQNYMWLVSRLYSDGYQFAAFPSKSGGLHLYFIFQAPEPAKAVREALYRIVYAYGMDKLFVDGKVSKVEVFPDKDESKPGVHAHCVFLPFFNSVGESPNRMLSMDGKLISIFKAINLITGQFTTVEGMNKVTDALPYSDAPYCLRTILLHGQLYEGMHRNDLLFTVAVYLKAKYGFDGFARELLDEANSRLIDPLDDASVTSCFNSAKSKDFPLLGQCKKNPMVEFCVKKRCEPAEYSPLSKGDGKVNNAKINVEFGKIVRMNSEAPYYLIEARPAENTDAPFVQLRVDSTDDLLSQRGIQAECINKLGLTFLTMKQQSWERQLNEVLSRQVVVEVPKETDTTETSEMRSLLYRFLAHKALQSTMPFRVILKQVYKEGDNYYFSTEGLRE